MKTKLCLNLQKFNLKNFSTIKILKLTKLKKKSNLKSKRRNNFFIHIYFFINLYRPNRHVNYSLNKKLNNSLK